MKYFYLVWPLLLSLQCLAQNDQIAVFEVGNLGAKIELIYGRELFLKIKKNHTLNIPLTKSLSMYSSQDIVTSYTIGSVDSDLNIGSIENIEVLAFEDALDNNLGLTSLDAQNGAQNDA